MEVAILTLSIISPPLKIMSLAKLELMKNKKLAANEKVLENRNSTIESFTTTMKNQLSFNKMIET
jgi:hypothetical protein